MRHVLHGLVLLSFLAFCGATPVHASGDSLPSWNDTQTKKSIIDFVSSVTDRKSADFVEPSERIATFDNDGTLWVEQPMYTQLRFALDRVKELAPQHPEWKSKQPFKAVLEKNPGELAKAGEKGLMQIVMETHSGMTTDEFQKSVTSWLETAKHPKYGKPYTQCVYQPMLELLEYLRANGFKTFIVSGGGVEFMRPWTEKIYGIPPEQVIGSSFKTKFEITNGQPVLVRLPQIFLIDDKAGKPVGINSFIGRRPIAAFGNSDGDLQMLQWTAAGKGKRFCLIVHHTDGEREYAYDRKSPFGRLDQALAEAGERGWTVVDMKKDWKKIFAFEGK